MAVRIFAIVVACFSIVAVSQAFDQAAEFSIRAKIRTLLTDPAQPMGHRMVAGLVRLAFHDCVGAKCDGCINLNNPENRGLDMYINKTEKVYAKLKVNGKPSLSRADFWALAGIEAIQFASRRATCRRCKKVYPKVKFQTGRKDCVGTPKGSPWTSDYHTFPDPLGTTEETTGFFKKQFGFNAMETVAILGAHSLGQAHVYASGFAHPWVERRRQFNNDYFIAMVNTSKAWKHVRLGRRRAPKWQWESTKDGRTTMMLNCDMSMLKNLTGVSQFGRVQGCTYRTCSKVNPSVANTAFWVKKFAEDNTLFMDKFGKAFQKMISNGYKKLKDVEPWVGFG